MTATAMSATAVLTAAPAAAPTPSHSLSQASASLHFSAPARVTVVQTLPLPNPSLTPWTWKVRLEGEQWRGESQLSVPPQQVGHYQLTFLCHSANQHCKGSLTLRNRTTGDELNFALTGHSTDPLVEPPTHLCAQAGQWSSHLLTVTNDCPALVEYHIDSDLPSLSAPPTLRVPPQSSAPYPFSIRAPFAGDFPATLTFTAHHDGRPTQRCFPLHLHVNPPPPISSLTLCCRCRSAVTAELVVTNPSPTTPALFAVEWTAACLDGPPTLLVPPSSSALYPLTFAPIRPGRQVGSVSFLHAEHGELVYGVVLEGEEGEVVEVEGLKVELGRSDEVTIGLHNASSEDVTLSASLTNPQAFSVHPTSLHLSPSGLGQVHLRYSPTRLHEEEQCELKFSHPRAGEWRYHIRCIGLAPLTPFPATSFIGFVQQEAERTLSFRNPHPTATTFRFALEPQSAPFVLTAPAGAQVLTASEFTLTVAALTSVAVVIDFCAPLIQSYSATLVVTDTTASPTLCWQYPLQGVGEGLLVADVLTLTTKAKHAHSTLRSLEVPFSSSASTPHTSPLVASIELDDGDQQPRLRPGVIDARVEGEPRIDASAALKVGVRLLWSPMKAMSARGCLVLSREGGGRWRWPLRLLATEADVEDVVELEAEVGGAQLATLHLTNAIDRAAAYRAYLATSSSPFFKVAPKTGRLPPSSAEKGAALTVSFAPLDYGKLVYEGQLVVETEEVEWRFALRGTHPKHTNTATAQTARNRLTQQPKHRREG